MTIMTIINMIVLGYKLYYLDWEKCVEIVSKRVNDHCDNELEMYILESDAN